VRDYTCGYRAYRAGLLQRAFGLYGDGFIGERGFQCQAAALLKLRRMGARMAEVPMVLRYDRKGGASKMRVGTTALSTVRMMLSSRFAALPQALEADGRPPLPMDLQTVGRWRWRGTAGRSRKVVVILGTRADAAALAPVCRALAADPRAEPLIVATGRDGGLLATALAASQLAADVQLDRTHPAQAAAATVRQLVGAADALLSRTRPDAVLVRGGGAASLAAALAAFYRQVPVGVVEAGRRHGEPAGTRCEPMNRRLTEALGRWCFAADPLAADRLRAEGIDAGHIFLSGPPAAEPLAIAGRIFEVLCRGAPAADRPAATGFRPRPRPAGLLEHLRGPYGIRPQRTPPRRRAPAREPEPATAR
jgi:hypothetical protein